MLVEAEVDDFLKDLRIEI